MKSHPRAPLLVVEDSDEDYKILLRIFRKLGVSQPVQRCVNAQECFDYLYATGEYADRKENKTEEEMPALILLDLNLPGLNGHAILRRLKAEPALKHLPVVVVTTSANPKDVQACYEAGANSYLVKAMDYTAYEQTIRHFVNYWFDAVLLPFAGEVK